MKFFNKNCCDGIYNSFDVHFTSTCDNKCAHCIDSKYEGLHIKKPDVSAIIQSIIDNQNGYDDVLFLGGEPCLYLEELYDCIVQLKEKTKLKLYVTTSIPKVCFDKASLFYKLIGLLDGINLSVQHYDESIADQIRGVKSKYDRQSFYNTLPYKEKIRINLNIVKPFLYTKEDITDCLMHYDRMGFNEIKLSEIQHGKDQYVSFEKTFNIHLGNPYSFGCQKFIDTSKILPEMKTPLLLKRSCFACEQTLNASFIDGIKLIYKFFNMNKTINYSVIYENGFVSKGWR